MSTPPTSAAREIRAILAARPACRTTRSNSALSHRRIRPARHAPRQLSEDGGQTVRADCGPRHRPDLRSASTWSNRPHWNHGRASQRNLAAQVANPADLVQPRAETPVLASRRTTAIDKYRKGEPTATQYPDANKGKISDVGQ